jgi:hypothetical protein
MTVANIFPDRSKVIWLLHVLISYHFEMKKKTRLKPLNKLLDYQTVKLNSISNLQFQKANPFWTSWMMETTFV